MLLVRYIHGLGGVHLCDFYLFDGLCPFGLWRRSHVHVAAVYFHVNLSTSGGGGGEGCEQAAPQSEAPWTIHTCRNS